MNKSIRKGKQSMANLKDNVNAKYLKPKQSN